MVSLGPFVPLLATAAVLFAGNGLQGTLIALRTSPATFRLARRVVQREPAAVRNGRKTTAERRS